MNNLPCAQESNDFVNVWVVGKAQYIVVGRARFLLGSHVFHYVCDGVCLDCKISRAERYPGSIHRVDSIRMTYVVVSLAVLIEALRALAVRKLTDYASDYFQVPQFLGSYVGKQSLSHIVRHGETLREISKRSA